MQIIPELLMPGEDTIPQKVSETIGLLKKLDIWHVVSRNTSSKSCRDAANRRYRLGTIGIPLEDELKSFFGYYILNNGKKQFVALHCRATDNLHLGKARNSLDSPTSIQRLNEEEDTSNEIGYGLVNPFQFRDGYNDQVVIQVFDSKIFNLIGLPGTMMTNAGSLTWAVEFFPAEVTEKLGGEIKIHDIVEDTLTTRSNIDAKIGILTGNGPDSGMLLWDRINAAIQSKYNRQFKGDLSYPSVSVESIPGMGLSMELDTHEEQVEQILIDGMKKLGDSGATIFTLACNTTPYFSEKLRIVAESFGGEFVGIPDALYEYVRIHSIKSFSLVGIKYVTDLNYFSGFKKLTEISKIETISDKGLSQILDLGYSVKREGVSEKGLQKLRLIINRHTSNDVVVIALTEMSVLLKSQKKRKSDGKIIVDTVDVYADFISDKYLFDRNAPEIRFQ